MKIIKILCSIIALITFFIVLEDARAENSIRYEGQSIRSGEFIDLTVDVDADEVLKNAYIEMAFHNKVIDIKSIKLANPAQGRVEYEVAFINDSGYIRMHLNSEIHRKLQLIFKIEGLFSAEQQTAINVNTFKVNELDVEYTQSNAIINVRGGNVRQGIIYNLSVNYANPFNWFTKFPFAIEQEGELDLRIYDYNGQELFNNSSLFEQIRIFRLQKGGHENLVPCESCTTYKLPTGRYRLEFDPDEQFFGCGTYYLTMKVNNVFMCQPFTFVR